MQSTRIITVFIVPPRELTLLLPPHNGGRQARLEAGARYERTLEAVACTPLLGSRRMSFIFTA